MDDDVIVGMIAILYNFKKDILCRCVMVTLTIKVSATIT